jgi:recombination protein RecA
MAKDEKETKATEVKGATKDTKAAELKKAKDEKILARKKEFLKEVKRINAAAMKKNDIEDTVISPIKDFGGTANVKRFSSGSLVLDSISGGGFPEGRIIEIYGPEASGKTSIALNAIANVQREGGNAVFVDAEQALDTNYASILGVNVEELVLAQVSVAEDALQMCADLAKSGTTDLIVVDSVAALVPRQEAEGDMDKQQVGLMARVMSKALRVLTPICAKNGVTIIFLNQIREKVGVMFGNPETTPGGKALKFFASQRIEIRRKGQETEGKEIIGTVVRMKMVKNKVAAPFKEGLTVLTFAHGINRPAEMLVIGEEMGIIKKEGRSFYFEPDVEITLTGDISSKEEDGRVKIATSKADAVIALRDEKELFESIVRAVSERIDDQREGITQE